MAFMFFNCTLSTTNYSSTLIGWNTQSHQDSVSFHGGNSTYNVAGGVARTDFTSNHSWVITDGGAA